MRKIIKDFLPILLAIVFLVEIFPRMAAPQIVTIMANRGMAIKGSYPTLDLPDDLNEYRSLFPTWTEHEVLGLRIAVPWAGEQGDQGEQISQTGDLYILGKKLVIGLIPDELFEEFQVSPLILHYYPEIQEGLPALLPSLYSRDRLKLGLTYSSRQNLRALMLSAIAQLSHPVETTEFTRVHGSFDGIVTKKTIDQVKTIYSILVLDSAGKARYEVLCLNLPDEEVWAILSTVQILDPI